jgi:hypothetical protein
MDFIDLLKSFEPKNEKNNSKTTITNSTVIIGSNNSVSCYYEIQQLPKEVQPIATELLTTLQDAIAKNELPKKTFKNKFSEFIKNYGVLIPSIGKLALELLSQII